MLRVQQGDAEAYHALFERHRVRLYGFLLRRVHDRALADDLFQESFLAVFRARRTWKPDRPFRPWLFRIAVNAARDRDRRDRRKPAEAPLEEIGGERPLDLRLSVTDRVETRIRLEQALSRLPEHFREAFLLGVVEGLDHNELAAVLDITPANARARVSRARAKLRELLGGRP